MAVAFHLALPEEWEAARLAGSYTMSTRGLSLAEEGFIHCSTAAQVEGVANRFYGDVDALTVLTVDLAAVGVEVRWEPPAPGVDDLYPHIYGPLPVDAVIETCIWQRGDAGWSFDATP